MSVVTLRLYTVVAAWATAGLLSSVAWAITEVAAGRTSASRSVATIRHDHRVGD